MIEETKQMQETASNQQIDQDMRTEYEFQGSKPVAEGFFADINNSQACSVRVAVKCRPLLGRELCERQAICLETDDGANTITIGKDRCFTFDKVFGINSRQADVFEQCVKNLVLGCFQGYNATVLAYGQTGSGKTFTMGSGYTIGVSEENQGIIPRVNQFIFDEIEARKGKSEFIVKCAFLEIYNEELVDLLDCSSTTTMLDRIMPQKKDINIREEKNGMISVYPLREVEVKSPEELAQCLDLGSNQRSVASTLMNQQSSRSHAIFTITIEQHFIEDLVNDSAQKGTSQDEFMIAKFHFVDLAGSERAKKTGATGATMKEGININKSLLSLGNVIAALTDEGKKNAHVPYRDSKLTRILQDSLGGNSRTSMIACCSPAETNFEETLNTLKYASRARNIKNKPVVNRDPASLQIAALRQQVCELQIELCNTRDVLVQHAIPFASTIVLPAKSSLIQSQLNNRQIAGIPTAQSDIMGGLSGAEIKKMESQIQELKATVAAKEKELQSQRAKLEALQDQHQQTQIDQFGAQRDRDLCRYQLEQVITALKKHKSVYIEVVKEINDGKLPSDFNPATSSIGQIFDPVFGSAGQTILQEYQTKVEEQRIEIEKTKLELQQFCNDNQQLIEQASRDMKSLESKELEIEKLKRIANKLQKENEQIKIDQRKAQSSAPPKQEPKYPRRGADLTRPQVAKLPTKADDNWLSNELDNKMKQFEAVRKGFIDDLTNQMSKALMPQDKKADESMMGEGIEVAEVCENTDLDFEQEPEEDSNLNMESGMNESAMELEASVNEESIMDVDKELLAKITTSQREVTRLDNQMLDMEQVLQKFKASQRDMEQSLLKAMEEEYHNKIMEMHNELKRLEAAKSEDLKKATGTSAKTKIESQFKQKETEMQTKIQELKNKEKEQANLQKALAQQKVKSKQLETELENMKHHKVQMLKKMRDDEATMRKWKQQRAQEVMDLKKQILKKDKENDALKRENKKREIFAKRKQEEVIAMQQKQKLQQTKQQNATKQRQDAQNIDVDKIKEWILCNTEKYVDFRDIENAKEKEIVECEQIEQEIESNQEQYSKMIVQVEKLEQQKSRLEQAPEGTQDDRIYSLSQEVSELSAQMKDIQCHIESLEDKQAFINEKISKYNCDLIKLKDPEHGNVLEDIPLQSQEGIRATVKSFFDILLDINMAFRQAESKLSDKEAEVQMLVDKVELIMSEIELVKRQKSLECQQIHQEYMEKEHKLIQFMIDNTGMDLSAKAEEESLQDINILSLLSLFIKQKTSDSSGVLSKDYQSINPGIVKASVATQRLKEEKQEAFNQSKAALARQVADLERQLQEAQVINKRLKNDQAQAYAEKSKYKRLLDNEIDKNKKRVGVKDEPHLLSQSHNFMPQTSAGNPVSAQSQGNLKMQSLKDQRNQRKLKKLNPTGDSKGDADVVMVDEEEEESKEVSPLPKSDVFQRLTAARGASRAQTVRDSKHNYSRFINDSGLSPVDVPNDDEDSQQDLQQNWELVIDKPDAHKSQIYAMTSVGTHIYSSANKSLKIWDVETMKYISDLPEKIGLVKAIAFWNERNLLLTAAEKVIMMWDVISLTTVGKFQGFKEEIKALQLIPGTDLLFAASKGTPTSGGLLIYDLRKSQQPLDEKERNQDIFSLTAYQNQLFYGCRNHTVNPFCLKTFTSLATLHPPHFDVVTSLAVLGNSNPAAKDQAFSLVSGSRDKNLRRFSINEKEQTFTSTEAVLNAHSDQINALETDNDRTTLYSGSKDGVVKVWSMGESALTCRAVLEGNQQNSSVNTICKLDADSAGGQAFACGSTDRSIRIWRYTQGQKLHTQKVVEKAFFDDSSSIIEKQDVQMIEPRPVTLEAPTMTATDRLRQRRMEKQLAQQNNN